MAASQKIAVVQTEAPATPADVTPAPAPIPAAAPTPPTAPGADREMLEIFLEEASEVLSAMEGSIAQARGGSGASPESVRRSSRRVTKRSSIAPVARHAAT